MNNMIQLNPFKSLDTKPIQFKEENKYTPVNNEDSDFLKQMKQIHQGYSRTPEQRDEAIKEQADQMEAQFVKLLVDQMFKSINKTGFIHGGQGEEIFQSMLQDQYAEQISKNTNYGISETIYAQITGRAY